MLDTFVTVNTCARYKKVGNWLAYHTLRYQSTADYILFVSCRGLLSIKGSWQFYLVQVTFSRRVPTRSSVCVFAAHPYVRTRCESLVVNAEPENCNKNENKSKTENKTTAAVEKGETRWSRWNSSRRRKRFARKEMTAASQRRREASKRPTPRRRRRLFASARSPWTQSVSGVTSSTRKIHFVRLYTMLSPAWVRQRSRITVYPSGLLCDLLRVTLVNIHICPTVQSVIFCNRCNTRPRDVRFALVRTSWIASRLTS